MSDSCIVTPGVRNSKGEIVDSRLFKSLLSFFDGDRKQAFYHYKIATDKGFLDAHNDGEWVFDDLGEINLQQYAQAIKLERPDFPTMQALERELHAGSYGFNEAIEKVEAFNRRQPESSRFVASLRQSKKSSAFFEVYIAPNNEATFEQLEKVVQGRHLIERLVALLAKNGVSVDFIHDNPRYSTENAEQTIDGLYSLIHWREGGDIGEHAEQVGHFIIAALGDHPLAERLQNLLQDEEARKSLLKSIGADPETINLGSDPVKTVAGMIVGKALERKLSNNIFTKLTDRLINAFNKLIKAITKSDIVKAKAEAKLLASQAASQFVQGKLKEDGVQNAIKKSETRWTRTKEAAKKDVSLCLNSLEALRREVAALEDLDKAVSSKLKEVIESTGEIYPNEGMQILEPAALVHMAQGMSDILNSIRPDNSAPISENTPLIELEEHLKEASNRLVKYTLCARTAQDMVYLLNTYDSRIRESLKGAPNGQELLKQYLDTKKNLEEHVADVFERTSSAYLNESRNIAAAYLSSLYGDRFVEYNEGLLWNGSRGDHVTFTFGDDPTNKRPNKIDITKFVYEDDGPLQRLMGSLINSKDIGAQLIVRAIKASKRSAERKMGECFSELMALDEKARHAGIRDYQRFYETNEKGELTGNLKWLHLDPTTGDYIELNWHQYEQDQKKLYDEIYAEFVKSEQFEIYQKASAAVKQVILSNYFDAHPKRITWDNTHSMFSKEHNQYIPNPALYSKPLTLNDKEIKWYQEYKKIFSDYKSLLGNKKMAIQLAPQTRGSIWNTMKNLKSYKKGAGVWALGRSIKDAICSLWSQDHSLVNEASHYNWNTEEESILHSYIDAKNGINTGTSRILPVYHTRKLKDPQRLDTNLIAATMKFAAMAAQYNASAEIQSALEISVQQLETRTVYESEEDKKRSTKAGSTARKVSKHAEVNDNIREYVDAHFYGLNYGIFDSLRGLTHNKFAQSIAAVGGKVIVAWYLANNIMSSGANLLTGFVEITKDAIVGNEFNMKDYIRANTLYFAQIPLMAIDLMMADNKLSGVNLFDQKFNALDKSREYYTSYRTWGERMLKWFNPLTVAMAGYSLTEHYMQSIPYMAMAMHTKLYTEDGQKTDLWKELTRRVDFHGEIEKESGKKKKIKVKREVLTLNRTVFDSKQALYKYQHTKQLLDMFKAAKDQKKMSMSAFIETIKSEHSDAYKYLKEVLSDEGILDSYFENDTVSYDDFIKLLTTRCDNLTYNEDKLQDFGQKAREATNRLHGVYNREDKSVFHRSLLGMLLLPFKGYAFGMMQKRFGGRHYNVALGRESEGYFNSSLKGAISAGRDVKNFISGSANYIISSITSSSQSEKDYYAQMASEAIKHLPALALSFFTNNKDVLDKAGMNKTQAENFRHTVLSMAVITAIGMFILYAGAMAAGTEDDEKIEELLVRDENNKIDVAKSRDNIEKYMKERGYSMYDGDLPFDDPDHEMFTGKINMSQSKLKSLQRDIKSQEEYTEKGFLYLLEELKRLNRQYASLNRPGWNTAYAFANKVYGEQLAFNSYTGLKKEGLGFDILPLSFKAMLELGEMIDIAYTTNSFEKRHITLADENASDSTIAQANEYLHLSNMALGKENETEKLTVNEAITLIQMSPVDLRNAIAKSIEANPNINNSDKQNQLEYIKKPNYIVGLQQNLAKHVKRRWKEIYPDESIDDYFFTKSKKGHHPRFASKSDILIEYKLNPTKRLEYVEQNSKQYTRDIFFGQTSKK